MAFKGFKFNLLPPKSKVEIQKEEKRTSSVLYAALLIFFTAIVWVGTNLLGLLIKTEGIDKWESINQEKDSEISSHQDIMQSNYELFTKSRSLSSVVLKHTDPGLVFNLINSIVRKSSHDIEITRYTRNSSGNYQITGVVNNKDTVPKLMEDFSQNENIIDVNLVNLASSGEQSEEYKFILDLQIKETNGGTEQTSTNQ